MNSICVIESSRLLLRPFETDDVAAVLEYQSDPDVVRYVPWPVRDESMVEEAITKAMAQTEFDQQGDYLSLAMVRKSDGRVLGQMHAMYVSEQNECFEIGYVVNPRFSRQGFATEASGSLVSAIFDTNRFRRVIAKFDERNVASRAVVERLGFRQEAHFRDDALFKGEWVSTVLFAILRDEWRQNKKSSD